MAAPSALHAVRLLTVWSALSLWFCTYGPGHSGTTGSQSVDDLRDLLADTQITMIVLSHADKDHYALLPQVFDLSVDVPAPLATLARVVLGGKRRCYRGAIDRWLLALSARGVTVETINHEQPCWNCGVLFPCRNPGVTATVIAANQVRAVCRYCRTTTLDQRKCRHRACRRTRRARLCK